jgi:hypothetical protein
VGKKSEPIGKAREWENVKEIMLKRWANAKTMRHKTVFCTVLAINADRGSFLAELYHNGMEYLTDVPTGRLPKEYIARLAIGMRLPLYVISADIDVQYNITILANPYSTRIPEMVTKNLVSEAGGESGYIRCVRRILGKFSKIISEHYIAPEIVRKASDLINGESINIYHLSDEELDGLLNTKIYSLKYFIKRNKRG